MRSSIPALKGLPQSRSRDPLGRWAEPEVRVSRLFDAPRERVFAAWTSPERLMGWWGVDGLTTTFCLVDLRPGGAFLCRMRSFEGFEVWSGGLYHEVVDGERLVFTAYFGDDADDGVPIGTLVTVTFADEGGKTKLTLRETAGILLGMEAGLFQD